MMKITAVVRPNFVRYIIPEHLIRTAEGWFQAAGRDGVEDVIIVAGYSTPAEDAVAVSVLRFPRSW